MEFTFSELQSRLLKTIAMGEASTQKLFLNFVTKGTYSKAGFYKALGKLCDQEVIFKTGDSVLVNTLWASEMLAFFSEMTGRSDGNWLLPTLAGLEGSDRIAYSFSDVGKVDIFILNSLISLASIERETSVYIKQPFELFLLLNPTRTKRLLENFTMEGRKLYLLSGGGASDLELFRAYKNETLRTHVIGYKQPLSTVIHTVGDYILELRLDRHILSRAWRIYQAGDLAVDERQQQLRELFAKTGRYTIIIYKDQLKSTQLRKEFAKYFILSK